MMRYERKSFTLPTAGAGVTQEAWDAIFPKTDEADPFEGYSDEDKARILRGQRTQSAIDSEAPYP